MVRHGYNNCGLIVIIFFYSVACRRSGIDPPDHAHYIRCKHLALNIGDCVSLVTG